MTYINLETLTAASRAEITALMPNTSLPQSIPSAVLADLGYAVLEHDPEPEIAPGATLELGDVRREGDRAVQGWVIIPAPEPDPVDWPAMIAARRWQAETGGAVVEGMPLDTGRDSQALITGAAVSAMLDSNYTVRWKTQSGFVELNAEQIIAVASAVRAHVQACFDREAELLAALDADDFTPAMLEEGWPNGSVPAPAES